MCVRARALAFFSSLLFEQRVNCILSSLFICSLYFILIDVSSSTSSFYTKHFIVQFFDETPARLHACVYSKDYYRSKCDCVKNVWSKIAKRSQPTPKHWPSIAVYDVIELSIIICSTAIAWKLAFLKWQNSFTLSNSIVNRIENSTAQNVTRRQ